MNLIQYYEELDAEIAAADRFDGWGDPDKNDVWYEEYDEAEWEKVLDEMMLAGELEYGCLTQAEAAPYVRPADYDDDIEF